MMLVVPWYLHYLCLSIFGIVSYATVSGVGIFQKRGNIRVSVGWDWNESVLYENAIGVTDIFVSFGVLIDSFDIYFLKNYYE